MCLCSPGMQMLALLDKLEMVNADEVAACEHGAIVQLSVQQCVTCCQCAVTVYRRLVLKRKSEVYLGRSSSSSSNDCAQILGM